MAIMMPFRGRISWWKINGATSTSGPTRDQSGSSQEINDRSFTGAIKWPINSKGNQIATKNISCNRQSNCREMATTGLEASQQHSQ